MNNYAFFNGDFLPYEELKVNASDLSIHRGYGIFDYFVERNGKVVWLNDYLDRFYQSAKLAGLKIEYTMQELESFIGILLSKNQKINSGVKLILTGGHSNDGFTPSSPSNLMIVNLEFPVYNPEVYIKGCTLILDEFLRPNPEIKSINYFNSALCIDRMKKAGAIDVIYHFGDIVYETSKSNIYIIKDGTIKTKKDKILMGVTRKNVLKMISSEFQFQYADFSVNEMLEADEVFITSSTKGVMPVNRIEDHVIGNGNAGPISKKLHQAFKETVDEALKL